jgi:hypothetical protein
MAGGGRGCAWTAGGHRRGLVVGAWKSCLIQALDFRKVSIKKAEKKVPLGAIK